MEANHFTVLYWFCHTSAWICHGYTHVPHAEAPSHLPPHTIPLGSSQCTSPKHPVSCIEPGLVIRFIYDVIHVSMPFSQIIPPSPSPTESNRKWKFESFLYLFLKTFNFVVGYSPINNVAIVSDEQWRNSAIHIHASILSQISSHPGCHITLSKVSCTIQWSLLVIRFEYSSVCMSILNSLTIPSPQNQMDTFNYSL